jgi:hypothetical protein
MIPRVLKANAGQALVAVLLLTMLTVLLGTQTFAAAWSGLFAAETSAAASASAAAAEGAVDFGIAALNTTIPTGSQGRLLPLPDGFVSTGPRTWQYHDKVNGSVLGDALVDLVQSLTIEVPATIPVTGGGGRPEDYRILTAVARADGRLRRVRAIAFLDQTRVTVDQPVFSRAITSAGDLHAGGDNGSIRTDSYRSMAGAYGGANVGDAGGVHTNGSVIGGGVYRGNVSAAGSIDDDVVVQGAGNQITAAAPMETIPALPPAPASVTTGTWQPGDSLQAPVGAALRLGGVSLSGQQTLTLLPGTYMLDSLEISGGGCLTIPGGGRVTLVINGPVAVTGNGIVTTSQRPLDLHLIATGTGQTVKIAGNGVFYGLLQAPGAPVILGGQGVFFGAIIADSVTFNGSNSTVHYDEEATTVAVAPAVVARPAQFRVVAVDVVAPE